MTMTATDSQVRCGNRRVHGSGNHYHATSAQVALCFSRPEGLPTLAQEAEAAEQARMQETCEHGMSKWLCEDPITHYPSAEAERASSSEHMSTTELMSATSNDYHRRGENCPWDCAHCPGNIAADEAERAAEGYVAPKVETPDASGVMAALAAAGAKPAAPPQAETAVVITKAEHPPWDGFYTIENPTSGLDHRTFRLRTQDADADFAPGKQVIGYLSGPDNERDYTNFGFVDRNALGYFVRVWSKHRNNLPVQRDAEQLLLDPDSYITDVRCIDCHRRLTVPASMYQGRGPDCAKKAGV